MNIKTSTFASAVIVALALISGPVACTMHRQHLIAEAIKNGNDPIATRCALDGETNSGQPSSVCLAKALER